MIFGHTPGKGNWAVGTREKGNKNEEGLKTLAPKLRFYSTMLMTVVNDAQKLARSQLTVRYHAYRSLDKIWLFVQFNSENNFYTLVSIVSASGALFYGTAHNIMFHLFTLRMRGQHWQTRPCRTSSMAGGSLTGRASTSLMTLSSFTTDLTTATVRSSVFVRHLPTSTSSSV